MVLDFVLIIHLLTPNQVCNMQFVILFIDI